MRIPINTAKVVLGQVDGRTGEHGRYRAEDVEAAHPAEKVHSGCRWQLGGEEEVREHVALLAHHLLVFVLQEEFLLEEPHDLLAVLVLEHDDGGERRDEVVSAGQGRFLCC